MPIFSPFFSPKFCCFFPFPSARRVGCGFLVSGGLSAQNKKRFFSSQSPQNYPPVVFLTQDLTMFCSPFPSQQDHKLDVACFARGRSSFGLLIKNSPSSFFSYFPGLSSNSLSPQFFRPGHGNRFHSLTLQFFLHLVEIESTLGDLVF